MNKVMKKMGRTLGNSNFSKMLNETENSRIFVLKSGAEARFILSHVLHDDIEDLTYVDAAVNGRDQSFLTPESVSDIARTIKLQQFFPAIGREIDGRIEVLDGSRRRAACIYNGTSFEVLVTKDELTLADARQLAIDIQTAKEHTLRELGKRLKVMYSEEINKSEIAAMEGLSAAKVTRAFQAASVPDEIISVFPSVSDLAITDYQTLLAVAEQTLARHGSYDDIVEKVRNRMKDDSSLELDDPTVKTKIIGYFRTESANVRNGKADKKIIMEKMANFTDKKQFARKKIDTEKRLVTYEFSRLPTAYQTELDEAVRSVIQRMQEQGKTN